MTPSTDREWAFDRVELWHPHAGVNVMTVHKAIVTEREGFIDIISLDTFGPRRVTVKDTWLLVCWDGEGV